MLWSAEAELPPNAEADASALQTESEVLKLRFRPTIESALQKGTIDTAIQTVELITQVDESTYRELERRAKRRQRTVSDEAAELLRQAVSADRAALIARLQSLHASLKSHTLTPSPELIRDDRESR